MATAASMYVLAAFTVGNSVSELDTKLTSVLMYEVAIFKPRAVCVALETGLLASLVLSTLFKPKLVFAPTAVVAPVPPLVMATVPLTLSAFPAMSPETLPPLTPAIFASVTAASASFVVVIFPSATTGRAAVPARSPAS